MTTATTKTSAKLKSYTFQIYTKDPKTGQGGWYIKVGFVSAFDADQGREKVKNYFGNRFDIFIEFYECAVSPLGCETIFIR